MDRESLEFLVFLSHTVSLALFLVLVLSSTETRRGGDEQHALPVRHTHPFPEGEAAENAESRAVLRHAAEGHGEVGICMLKCGGPQGTGQNLPGR